MKKLWKWIIGIVIGLVVLAVLVGVGFAFRMHNAVGFRGMRGWDDGFGRGFGMMPFGGMHGGRFGMLGGGLGMLFGGLLQLGFLVLLVLGIIWLVRKLWNPAPVATPVVQAAPEAPVAAAASCSKCGYPVQNEWKVCPNCGKKL